MFYKPSSWLYQQGLKGKTPTAPQGSQGSSRGCKVDPKTIENQAQREKFDEVVWKCCPLDTIRKYFCQINQNISAYQQGYKGPQSQVLMKKYKSHCCIPQHAAMSMDMLTS
jgi:hypothetical protein